MPLSCRVKPAENKMRLTEWMRANKNIFTYSDLQFLLRDLFHDKDILFKQENIFLDGEKLKLLETIKNKYKSGMPIAYMLGKEEFFGLEFNVSPSVLIPRPDTEIIIEKAIKTIKANNLKTLLDLCCGSANIAISIKKFFKDKIKVCASDISEKAITVGRGNIKLHKARIDLRKGDLFKAFPGKKFDIIVSNPPYVASSEIKGSLLHEPRIALAAGNDGMYFVEKIIKNAHLHLKRNGFLVIEAGHKHREPINSILEKTGKYEIIEWIYDYGSNFRGVVLKKLRLGRG